VARAALALATLAHLGGGACALRSRAAPETDPEERAVLGALGAGELPRAQAGLPAAVAAAERRHAAEPLALADRLERLAEAFSAEIVRSPGALATAETLRRRVLALRQSRLGPNHALVGESLSNLSTTFFDQGRWDPALEYERQALAAFESSLGPDSVRAARSRRELANVLFQEGRYSEAATLLDRVLEALERIRPPEALELARSLNVAIEVRRVAGRCEEAEAAGRRGLELLRRAEPTDPVLLGDLLNNLAGLYKDEGRYDEAESTFQEVMDLRERDSETDSYDLALARMNQADIFQLQGRLEEAAPLFDQALSGARRALGESDPQLATFLNRSAFCRVRLGLHAEAEPLYRSALDLLERTTPGHPEVAQTLHDLAGLRRALGRHGDARHLYERALALREAAFGPRHPEVAVTLTELARTLHEEGPGHDGDALALAERAVLILSATSAYPEARTDALALQAEILRRRGDEDGALSSMAAALQVVEDQRPRTGGSEATRAEFLARYAGYFRRMASWLLEADRLSEAIDYAERGRARVLLDQLALAHVDLARDIPPGAREPLEAREGKARARLAEIQARLVFTDSRADLGAEERASLSSRLSGELDAAAREVQEAGSELRRASPLWRGLVTAGGRPAPMDAIRSKLLGPGQVLLLYVVGSERSEVVAVPGGTARPLHRTLRVEDEPAAALGLAPGGVGGEALARVLGDGRTTGLVAALGGARGLARVRDARVPEDAERRLHALFQLIMPSEVWSRVREASEVLVVPDGALHLFPFEALVVGFGPEAAPRYWLDEGPVIRYAPSATTAFNLETRDPGPARAAGSALVVADPVFDRAREGGAPSEGQGSRPEWAGSLARLPGTAREAAAIRAAYGVQGAEVRVLTGDDAGEGAVRRALASRPREVLHFATHGIVDESRNALLAALALTPPRGGPLQADDDGFLQLYEIYDLDARSELTVLSACDSHAGRSVEGEGVFALSRAFLAAGARRVVASLWPVDDASTAALMGAFYERLAAGRRSGRPDYALALRDARREVRERREWAAPYYWAPFVVTGAR
jgi:CHAT domain-containing protein/tetratricopeptide (TPR) repeat protein